MSPPCTPTELCDLPGLWWIKGSGICDICRICQLCSGGLILKKWPWLALLTLFCPRREPNWVWLPDVYVLLEIQLRRGWRALFKATSWCKLLFAAAFHDEIRPETTWSATDGDADKCFDRAASSLLWNTTNLQGRSRKRLLDLILSEQHI